MVRRIPHRLIVEDVHRRAVQISRGYNRGSERKIDRRGLFGASKLAQMGGEDAWRALAAARDSHRDAVEDQRTSSGDCAWRQRFRVDSPENAAEHSGNTHRNYLARPEGGYTLR